MPDPTVANEVKDVSVSELYADAAASPTETSSSPATDTAQSADTSTETVNPQAGNEEVRQESLLTLKDRVAELGFKDVADDADAQQRLIEAYQLQQANQQQVQQQLEMMRYQAMLAQQAQQPQPAQAYQSDPQPQGWWNAPKTNEQLRQQFMIGKGEDGSIQWKPNTPPQIVSEYESEQAYYADWANKLVHDPVSALAGFKQEILAESQRQAQEFIWQQTQRQQAESFVQTQIRDNEDVFYQKDPVSKEIRRDFRGEPMLTEAGVRFDSILNELADNGMGDETARWRYAQQIYKAQYGDFRQQATQKIQQARAAHVAQTQPAVHIPARNGQDVNGRMNGGRPDMQTLGQRFLAANESMVFN